MALAHGPSIVTSGLVLALDAANINSYPGSGTTWTDLSGQGAHGTINGSVAYVSAGNASYFNWPAAASTNYVSSTVSQNYLDMTIVFQPDFTLSSNASLAGLIAISNDTTTSDKSLRFGGANGTGPWTLQNPDNTDGWASSATTFYVNGTSGATQLVSGWNILGGTRTNVTSFPANFSYFLGTEGYSTVRDFRGKIAAVFMYNRSLTASEQQQNFNALRGRYNI